MNTTYHTNTPPFPLHGNHATSRLVDLWQAEEQLAYRVDAWLIKYMRSFVKVSSESVSVSRRVYAQARHNLSRHVAARGRAVARIPFVSTFESEPSLSAAARQLQHLHRDLMRIDERADHALQVATRDRDFGTVALLAEVSEAHHLLETLIRDLFEEGQRMSRMALTTTSVAVA